MLFDFSFNQFQFVQEPHSINGYHFYLGCIYFSRSENQKVKITDDNFLLSYIDCNKLLLRLKLLNIALIFQFGRLLISGNNIQNMELDL